MLQRSVNGLRLGRAENAATAGVLWTHFCEWCEAVQQKMTNDQRLDNLERTQAQLIVGLTKLEQRLRSAEKIEKPIATVEGIWQTILAWLLSIWHLIVGFGKKAAPGVIGALVVLAVFGLVQMPGCPIPKPKPKLTITIEPKEAKVETDKTQQFKATPSDGKSEVEWSATGDGSVDDKGLFKAGHASGEAEVRAEAKGDPKVFGSAKVTVITPPLPPAPIPVDGFRVMFVFDPKKPLPQSQEDIFTSQEIRNYLDQHCAKVNGKTEWRMWPESADLSKESKIWQDAYARPHQTLPYCVISNGKTGWEGPLPNSVADMLTLLRKYGG